MDYEAIIGYSSLFFGIVCAYLVIAASANLFPFSNKKFIKTTEKILEKIAPFIV